MAEDEMVVLQHHMTEQTLVVALALYMKGAQSKYKHWRIKGQARFINPLPLSCASMVHQSLSQLSQ